MKIEIEIDDKYSERNLYVFAGIDPVIRKRRDKDYWEVKVAECSRCGKCCKLIGEDHPLGGVNGCKYLVDRGSVFMCGLGFPSIGLWRPHGCSIADPTWVDSCTVKWEKVND